MLATVLREAIKELLFGSCDGDIGENVLVADRRHREALIGAKRGLEGFVAGVDSRSPAELLALDLREGLDSLGKITGDTGADSILEEIFSRFCIGK